MIDQEVAVSRGPDPLKLAEPERTAGSPGGQHYEQAFTGDEFGAIQSRKSGFRPSRIRTPKDVVHSSALAGPEERAKFRSHWQAAREATEGMVRAAAAADMQGLAIAADDLDQGLAKLWDVRANRDVDWKCILNHVQGMMSQFFARKQVEELTEERCRKILTVVEDYLGPASKSVEDLNEVLRLIEDAGFDPLAAISGDQLADGVAESKDSE